MEEQNWFGYNLCLSLVCCHKTHRFFPSSNPYNKDKEANEGSGISTTQPRQSCNEHHHPQAHSQGVKAQDCVIAWDEKVMALQHKPKNTTCRIPQGQ